MQMRETEKMFQHWRYMKILKYRIIFSIHILDTNDFGFDARQFCMHHAVTIVVNAKQTCNVESRVGSYP